MMHKKRILTIISFSLFSLSAFCVELEAKTTVDTYSENIGGGVSFSLSGEMLKNMSLTSSLVYKGGNLYDTYCHVLFSPPVFSIGGGFGFFMTKNTLYPGASAVVGLHFGKWFNLSASETFGVNPQNLFDSSQNCLSDTRVNLGFLSSSAKIDIGFGYCLEKVNASQTEKFSGELKMTAYKDKIPFKFMLYTKGDMSFLNKSPQPSDMTVIQGTGLELDFGKHGTYSLSGEIAIISFSTPGKMPISISLSMVYPIPEVSAKRHIEPEVFFSKTEEININPDVKTNEGEQQRHALERKEKEEIEDSL